MSCEEGGLKNTYLHGGAALAGTGYWRFDFFVPNWAARSGKVLIRCPVGGKPVYTGVDMDREGFENTVFRLTEGNCRRCGGQHRGRKPMLGSSLRRE